MGKRCKNCAFWRFKGDSEADPVGIGICDNPESIKQVNIVDAEIMTRYFSITPETAQFIMNSLRFHGNFGCIHHSTHRKHEGD